MPKYECRDNFFCWVNKLWQKVKAIWYVRNWTQFGKRRSFLEFSTCIKIVIQKHHFIFSKDWPILRFMFLKFPYISYITVVQVHPRKFRGKPCTVYRYTHTHLSFLKGTRPFSCTYGRTMYYKFYTHTLLIVA